MRPQRPTDGRFAFENSMEAVRNMLRNMGATDVEITPIDPPRIPMSFIRFSLPPVSLRPMRYEIPIYVGDVYLTETNQQRSDSKRWKEAQTISWSYLTRYVFSLTQLHRMRVLNIYTAFLPFLIAGEGDEEGMTVAELFSEAAIQARR